MLERKGGARKVLTDPKDLTVAIAETLNKVHKGTKDIREIAGRKVNVVGSLLEGAKKDRSESFRFKK